MSNFSELLTTAVAASGLTQREVEDRTGIDHSALSRLMSGSVAPSRVNLSRLFAKFQPGTMVGHELVIAHLRDEAASAGIAPANLKISIGDASILRGELPAGLVADLDLLASEAAEDKDFATLVRDWAAVIRGHRTALERKLFKFSTAGAEDKKSTNAKNQRSGAVV